MRVVVGQAKFKGRSQYTSLAQQSSVEIRTKPVRLHDNIVVEARDGVEWARGPYRLAHSPRIEEDGSISYVVPRAESAVFEMVVDADGEVRKLVEVDPLEVGFE